MVLFSSLLEQGHQGLKQAIALRAGSKPFDDALRGARTSDSPASPCRITGFVPLGHGQGQQSRIRWRKRHPTAEIHQRSLCHYSCTLNALEQISGLYNSLGFLWALSMTLTPQWLATANLHTPHSAYC